MSGVFEKYAQNPIFGGGELGTCFDVYVSRENGRYRNYSLSKIELINLGRAE